MTTPIKMTSINGTDKSEKLLAKSGTGSMIAGNGGNDTIIGSGYSDFLNGGAGIDLLYGGGGDDYLYSFGGADGLTGGGADRLVGGDGNDYLYASAFKGTLLDGGTGNDRFNLAFSIADQNAIVSGGAGADAFNFSLAAGAIHDGTVVITDYQIGKDILTINQAGVDLANGSDLVSLKNTGSGLLVEIAGTDVDLVLRGVTTRMLGIEVDGGTWNTLDGTAKNDRITGSWMDVDGERLGRIASIDAKDGDDHVSGASISERIQGGSGHDTLVGNGGNDQIQGGTGNDRIYGGTGRDTLAGNDGDDTVVAASGGGNITGDAGNDALFVGGGTADTVFVLTGGDGADRFIFRAGSGETTITDFEIGIDTLTVNGIALEINADTTHVDTAAGILIEMGGHDILLQDVYL